MNSPGKTQKILDAAVANVTKLETALDRQQSHLVDLEAEVSQLAKDHRQEATAAAIEGEPAPPAPLRMAQAQAEITTSRAVLTDIESRLVDARAAVAKAEQNHVAARRRALVGPIEKRGRQLWLEIAERFTELVDLTGETGLEAVQRLTETCGPLWPEHDPVVKALTAEGLDVGEGGYIEILLEGTFAQDYTDGLVERHNGEPRPEQGAQARI